jgi:hypothetical protein
MTLSYPSSASGPGPIFRNWVISSPRPIQMSCKLQRMHLIISASPLHPQLGPGLILDLNIVSLQCSVKDLKCCLVLEVRDGRKSSSYAL